MLSISIPLGIIVLPIVLMLLLLLISIELYPLMLMSLMCYRTLMLLLPSPLIPSLLWEGAAFLQIVVLFWENPLLFNTEKTIRRWPSSIVAL